MTNKITQFMSINLTQFSLSLNLHPYETEQNF